MDIHKGQFSIEIMPGQVDFSFFLITTHGSAGCIKLKDKKNGDTGFVPFVHRFTCYWFVYHPWRLFYPSSFVSIYLLSLRSLYLPPN